MRIGSSKERGVLALLALRAGRPVSEGELAGALWGDDPPRSAHKAIQTYVSSLRRRLPEDAIVTASNGYALAVAPSDVDALCFEAKVNQARRSACDAGPRRTVHELDAALALWRGDPLVDLADQQLGMAECTRLQELRKGAEEDLAQLQLDQGEHQHNVAALEAAVAAEPFRERRWAQLMLALYRCGRQAEALRAYRRLCEQLGEELGIEPSAELSALEEAILLQKPELDWVTPDVGADLASADEGERVSAPLPTGVVTFVLTDIEGSARLWEASPRFMATALERHDEIIERIVVGHDGALLKSKGEGDSTLSAFRRASDAIGAAFDLARALQTEPWPGDLGVRVRIGLHTGEAHERKGDYYGPTLNRGARIRGLAEGGQILLSNATAELVQDRLPTGGVLLDLGQRSLRGLSRHERVFLLADSDTADEAARGVGPDVDDDRGLAEEQGLPGLLGLAAEARFVGRRAELNLLERLSKEATAGRRRGALIAGEPGVGKTALVARVAATAREQGCLVLYGRCDEGLGVPYQPFVEVLRSFLHAMSPERRTATVGHLGGELARLVPELGALVPGLPPPTKTDSESERYLLFEAVAGVLSAGAARTPLVVVLDDLHWATKPTLLLLRHILASSTPMAVLVVGTYRETEPGADEGLSEFLADAWRFPGVERIALDGLMVDEVLELLATTAAHPFGDRDVELARRVQVETEGNPFFLKQVMRHLVESGALVQEGGRWVQTRAVAKIAIPEGIRAVIGRRLARLERDTNETLALAAVFGREFDPRIVAAAGPVPEDRVLDALEQAEQLRLVLPSSTGEPRFAFAHALVRTTLYESIPETRRLRMHRQAALALERFGGDDRLDELAHHFCEAAPLGLTAKAAAYAKLAGDRALHRLAYEEAAEHYQRVLAVLDGDENHREVRSNVLLQLGRALWSAGDRVEARRRYDEVAELARQLDRPQLLAEAAVAHGGKLTWNEVGRVEPHLVGLLEAALSTLSAGDSRSRAMAEVRLATELYFSADAYGRRRRLAEEALAIARRLDEPETLAYVLNGAHFALWEPGNTRQRLDMARELLELARRAADPEKEMIANAWLVVDLCELGDLKGAADAASRESGLSETLGQPEARWVSAVHRAALAIAAGRLDEAQRLADEALSLGQQAQTDALQIYGVHQFALRRLLGGFEELEPFIRGLVEEFPTLPAWRTALAFLYREIGRFDEAREQFEVTKAQGGLKMPFDANWPIGMAMLSSVCNYVDDRATAGFLYERFLPFGDLVIAAGMPAEIQGSAQLFLALLAATLERWDGFEVHAAEALRRNAAMGVVPGMAIATYEVASVLAQRGRSGDTSRAHDLLDDCLETCRRFGLTAVEAKAHALAASI